jgi:thioredoxin reductase (NADPH)
MFLFIGASSTTLWLDPAQVALDPKGFVLTGGGVITGRPLLETSIDNVFAFGDIRSGSVKRVAGAVGEGAQVAAQLHLFLTKDIDLSRVQREILQSEREISARSGKSPQL